MVFYVMWDIEIFVCLINRRMSVKHRYTSIRLCGCYQRVVKLLQLKIQLDMSKSESNQWFIF